MFAPAAATSMTTAYPDAGQVAELCTGSVVQKDHTITLVALMAMGPMVADAADAAVAAVSEDAVTWPCATVPCPVRAWYLPTSPLPPSMLRADFDMALVERLAQPD